MNHVRNKKRATTGPRTSRFCFYRDENDFTTTLERNPEKSFNSRIFDDTFDGNRGNAINLNSMSGESQVILALTEGRGHAVGAVGLAHMDLSSPALILTQISDNVWYTDTLTKIQILNPTKILIPDTILETSPVPKLLVFIRETFGNVQLIPIQRKHFSDTKALELIKMYCSKKTNNLGQVVSKKYYALSAASALLTHLRTSNMLAFGRNCLKLQYEAKHLGMLIDTATSKRLELCYSTSLDPESKQFSLFHMLNKCVTRIGQRHLRANILEPSCSLAFIEKRQEQIKILISKSELRALLKETLQTFVNVDRLLKISYVVPQDDFEKAINIHIQLTLLLKFCMESVQPVADIVERIESEHFDDINSVLNLPTYKDIIAKINEVVQPDLKRMARKHFQYMYALKSGANETIDFLRTLYSQGIDKIRDHIEGLTESSGLNLKMIHSAKLGYHIVFKNLDNQEIPDDFDVIHQKNYTFYLTTSNLQALNISAQKVGIDIIKLSNSILCDMLIEIAQEIDVIYHLIGIIIELDIIQSLAEVSETHELTCPSFGKIMRVNEAYHPLLDFKRDKTTVIKNSVVATPIYNFFLLNGPNMSGKTIYIKMVAIIQILGQIGCFVPASQAQLRMTDKLFSRLTFQDNFEQHASSFTVELREMEYIYLNLTPNSLVIIDELCRSTNHQEGEVLCWKYCEKLLQYIGISDENYFDVNEESLDENESRMRNLTSLRVEGQNIKLKDVTKPFFFVTTHFNSTTKLIQKYQNVVNLHMKVNTSIVNDNIKLDFKYNIQHGPSPIKSYGLALARSMKIPPSLLDRADELVDEISEDAINEFVENSINKTKDTTDDTFRNFANTSVILTELSETEREVFDIFSYITLIMNDEQNGRDCDFSVETIEDKIADLIQAMTPGFREIVEKSSIEEIVNALNNSSADNSSAGSQRHDNSSFFK